MSGEELGRLVTAAGLHGDEIALLAVTGLRFGEFAALRVGDFDERRRRLMVRSSVSVVGSQMIWTTPKTHRTREVSVPPSLVPALLSRAVGRPADAVLFTSSNGQVLRLNWRRRVFALACEGAAIAGRKPQDRRHTAALLAVRSGGNVKVVQRMLGHASAATTLDVYSGLFDDDLDVVALAMDALVPQTRHNEDPRQSTSTVATRQKPVELRKRGGAPGQIRTADTRFRRAVLYPLSYEGGQRPQSPAVHRRAIVSRRPGEPDQPDRCVNTRRAAPDAARDR